MKVFFISMIAVHFHEMQSAKDGTDKTGASEAEPVL